MAPPDVVRLTQLSHGAGCGCKLRPADLAHVLKGLRPVKDRAVLVGPGTRDDAAVYRLNKDTALIATTDFFTPVVDDPFVFGRIAAANAISDVYAMGGTPLYALSLVAFPLGTLPAEMLGRILEGAQAACDEAGIEIVGGHSIDDPEPKFGLAVTGLVHPKAILSNAKARPGDVLVLTKPLGIGIATTAIKKGAHSPAIAIAIEFMSTLNRAAGEVCAEEQVHALTDVTGFGLFGHLWNICEASGVGAVIKAADVPIIEGVEALAQAGIVPGGTRRNLQDLASHVTFPHEMPEWKRLVLADAQTNGGLLASVSRRKLAPFLQKLKKRKVPAFVIGHVTRGAPAIVVE